MEGASGINFETTSDEDFVGLRVSGELDIATTAAFRACIARLSRPGVHVWLDLSGLTFVDVAGSRALEQVVVDGLLMGWLHVLAGVQPQVRHVLELSHASWLVDPAQKRQGTAPPLP